MLNKDYSDILRALSAEKVEFLLVGAYAMAAHGYVRVTMDIDLWVMPSQDNAEALLRALKRFGASLHDLTKEDFVTSEMVLQIGVAPRRIDIITGVTGLHFEEAFARSVTLEINGFDVQVPSLDDLICNKRASGRTQDLADAEALESLRDSAPTAGGRPPEADDRGRAKRDNHRDRGNS